MPIRLLRYLYNLHSVCHNGCVDNSHKGDAATRRLHNDRPQHLPLDFSIIQYRVRFYSAVRLECRGCKTYREIHGLLPASLPQLPDSYRPMLHIRHVHALSTLPCSFSSSA